MMNALGRVIGKPVRRVLQICSERGCGPHRTSKISMTKKTLFYEWGQQI